MTSKAVYQAPISLADTRYASSTRQEAFHTDRIPGLDASKIVSGSFHPNRFPNSGAVGGVYGNAYNTPVIAVDSKGRITGVYNQAIALPTSYYSYVYGFNIISRSGFGAVLYHGIWDIWAEGPHSGIPANSYGFAHGGYWRGYIEPNTNNFRMNDFTGSHRCSVNNNGFSSEDVGKIVISTGTYCTNIMDDDNKCIPVKGVKAITIFDALPVVELCTKPSDKRAFGVISKVFDGTSDTRGTGFGFVTVHKTEKGDVRVEVNGVGEGAIWVSNYNGNLENGDYITSSPLPGYGMKQDDDLLHNYTVAKITMDCDFNPKIVKKKIVAKDQDGNTILDESGMIMWTETDEDEPEYIVKECGDYKIAFVGCTYHCS